MNVEDHHSIRHQEFKQGENWENINTKKTPVPTNTFHTHSLCSPAPSTHSPHSIHHLPSLLPVPVITPRLSTILSLVVLFLSMGEVMGEVCGAGRYSSGENWRGANQCTNCETDYSCPGQVDDWGLGLPCFANEEDKELANNAPTFQCVASSKGSDRTSHEGKYYCINGGIVHGEMGVCSCTSCNTGFVGTHCEHDLDRVAPVKVSGTCASQSAYNGLYSPVGFTASNKPWYKNENNRTLYYDPDCGLGSNHNLWIFDSEDPSTTAKNDLDADETCNFWGYVTSTSSFPPMGTNIWEFYCDGSWKDTSLVTTPIWHVRYTTELFNKLSNGGNSRMSNGATVMMMIGDYKCSEGECEGADTILKLDDVHGKIKCIDDNAKCVMDAEGSRRSLDVDGTGGETLSVRAITFTNGEVQIGGGMNVWNMATVDIYLCVFSQCRATGLELWYGGGAIFVGDGGSTVNIFSTIFTDNSADNGQGDDIFRVQGSITIYDTCPPPYISNNPRKGEKKRNEERTRIAHILTSLSFPTRVRFKYGRNADPVEN